VPVVAVDVVEFVADWVAPVVPELVLVVAGAAVPLLDVEVVLEVLALAELPVPEVVPAGAVHHPVLNVVVLPEV
jgi:hypothetical protein